MGAKLDNMRKSASSVGNALAKTPSGIKVYSGATGKKQEQTAKPQTSTVSAAAVAAAKAKADAEYKAAQEALKKKKKLTPLEIAMGKR
jgi:hypothetical protein